MNVKRKLYDYDVFRKKYAKNNNFIFEDKNSRMSHTTISKSNVKCSLCSEKELKIQSMAEEIEFLQENLGSLS